MGHYDPPAARLADWLDALLRGTVGPIAEPFAELQVEILQQSLSAVRDLRDHAIDRLVHDEPECVGEVLTRAINGLDRALRSTRHDFTAG